MTTQTTDIDNTSGGNAVNLTNGDQFSFTIANEVIVDSEYADGIVADATTNFFIFNYGGIIGGSDGVAMQYSNDHFYNESSGSVFGYQAIDLEGSGSQTVVNYGTFSGDSTGVADSAGSNIISNFGTIEGPQYGLNLAGGDSVTNAGLIATDDGIGINTNTSTTLTTIANTGTIEGASSITAFGTGSLKLTNYGALDGDVQLANSGGDTVANTGQINGSVQLGAGSNIFDSRHGGTVSGMITGGIGVDTIYLGADGETVNGDGGHDNIYGGAGADTFVFSSDLGANWIHLYNFSVANDTIELEHSAFTKLKAGATPKFSIATAATSTTDFLYYNSTTGYLYYDTNGSAAGGIHLIAEMATGLKLTASNFTVV